ncbi:MAG: hypothetical protein WDO16_13255 [Bacteroidota bacterium]
MPVIGDTFRYKVSLLYDKSNTRFVLAKYWQRKKKREKEQPVHAFHGYRISMFDK